MEILQFSLQVEQELSDTRDQVVATETSNTSLTNAKRKLEGDINQMHADLDNLAVTARNAEDKARKAQLDAGRLADELRVEQEHSATQVRLIFFCVL